MSMGFSFTLALRFLKSKRFGPLARFISMASTVGICTGVCALIVGLSAMNGFEFELKNRVLSLVPAAEVSSADPYGFNAPDEVMKALKSHPEVIEAAPVIQINGAVSQGTDFAPAMVLGIDTEKERSVIDIERFMDCSTQDLDANEPSVILGYGIAKKLNAAKGDTVSLSVISSVQSRDGLGKMTMQPFKVAGFFRTRGSLDRNIAFISLKEAKELAHLKEANTIHIKVSDMLKADRIVEKAYRNVKEDSYCKGWFSTHGKLYSDINMIRAIMYLAMILVIAVACFNIVSNLMMAVSEKRHEIAILLTMGAKRSLIRRAFTMMGIFTALKGAVLGVLFGCLIASFTPYVTANFKSWFGIELLNENIYFINYVPSVLDYADVVLVLCCAVFMGGLASIYPAHKASRVNPAAELNI